MALKLLIFVITEDVQSLTIFSLSPMPLILPATHVKVSMCLGLDFLFFPSLSLFPLPFPPG